MKLQEFIERLAKVSNSYSWSLENNKVVARIKNGPNKGRTLNPLTALAHKAGFGLFDDNRENAEQAASLFGLSRDQARNIYSATIGTKNRGNVQVIRGKIRSALEV